MAGRIRTIKPEILDDEAACALSDAAWRLWVSVWLLADDYGNARAGTKYLAALVWQDSARAADVPDLLAELATARRITLYSDDNGQPLLHVNNWEKHQRIDNAGKPRVALMQNQEVSARFAEFRRDSPNLADSRESRRSDLRPPTSDPDPERESRARAIPVPPAPATTTAETQRAQPEPTQTQRAQWGKGRFLLAWEETIRTTTGGNWPLYDELAERCERSAAREGKPVEQHSRDLLRAFLERIEAWRAAKKPAPKNLSPEKFAQHFAACEEWARGVREEVATPGPNGHSAAPSTRPVPPPIRLNLPAEPAPPSAEFLALREKLRHG